MTAKRILLLLALLLAGGIISTGYSEVIFGPATGVPTTGAASAPAEPDFKSLAAKMNLTAMETK